MALDTTAADGILKQFYLPTVREQLNNAIPFLAQLERNTEHVESDNWRASVHLGRNWGIGARAEGGTLPTAGAQQYVKAYDTFKTLTGRIKITVQAIKALASNRSAFEKAVESEVSRITNDLKRDVNRQLFGTSNGVLATVTTSTTTTTVNLASTTTAVELRHLANRMVVDIGTVANPTADATGVTISALNTSAKTFTISGSAISIADGHKVFITGNGGATGGVGQKELTGLDSIVDSTGTVHNLAQSTYGDWASYESAVNGQPTEVVFETAIDEVEIASGQSIDTFWTTYGVSRGYANQLTAQKRFVDTAELKGGFKGLQISSGGRTAVLMRDRDCPMSSTTAGFAFGVSTPDLSKMEWCDWEWIEDPGILRQVTDQLAYEGTIYSMFDLATTRRNAHAKLSGLTES